MAKEDTKPDLPAINAIPPHKQPSPEELLQVLLNHGEEVNRGFCEETDRPACGRKRKKHNWPLWLGWYAATGNKTTACQKAAIPRSTADTRITNDPDMKALCVEAERIAADILQQEAHRRAVTGTNRPIYQGGKLVGYERQYSDKLMELLLKANLPDKFADRQKLDISGSVAHFTFNALSLPDSVTDPQPKTIEGEVVEQNRLIEGDSKATKEGKGFDSGENCEEKEDKGGSGA